MNYAAIWHEATQQFCYCVEPNRFRFCLRTAKDDLKQVTLHSRDKYLPLHIRDTRLATPMRKVASDGIRDYYEAELEFQVVCLRYCFELEDYDGNRVFLSNSGFTAEIPEDKERLFDCPQTLRETERFQTPRWAKNQVIYQIFPARFASSKPVSEDVWYQTPIRHDANLQGDLRGIIHKLSYIRDLGVDVIYMTPIFCSKSAHKYDTIDYYTIDPAFGTEADLIELVEKAHAMGMRVILDGVFNHTSPEFFAFADLVKNQEKSAYKDWYYVEDFPLKFYPQRQNYKCFGYFGGMPKVNLQNPQTAKYFTDVALYWLRKTGIDGWRLDVADEIAHDFWRDFRKAVKKEFPDALIVGEVWHHAPDFLQGEQWDSVMNYPFYRSLLDFAAAGSIPASEFLGTCGFLRGNTHAAVYPLLWNLAGSHDTARLRYLCGEDRNRQKLAAAIQLLMEGMPMIYYGDEVGMTGGNDPDCRRGMLWDESRQDPDMLCWYRRLLKLRREMPEVITGETVVEEADDADGLIRITRRGKGQDITILFHAKENDVQIPELSGKQDILSQRTFEGTVNGITAMVLI